ncbi:hypothetical protein ABZ468_32665 [Streptomyces sp. NPDC005708]
MLLGEVGQLLDRGGDRPSVLQGYFAGMLIMAVIVVEFRRPPFSLITPNS